MIVLLTSTQKNVQVKKIHSMSDFSSLPSLPYKKYYAPKKLKGGDSSSDAAIIAIVVVIIVILLVAIIMAACWGCGSQTETVYVTGADGNPVGLTMSKKKARAYRKSRAALKDLPPLNPHRRGGKTYELAAGNAAKVHDVHSDADARALLRDGKPAALFVYMNGCGFCDKAKAYFNDQYAQEHPNVTLAMIDGQKCRELCQEHGITGFPTFLTNFGGQGVQKHVGYKPKEVMSAMLASAGGARYGRSSRMMQGGKVHEIMDAEQAQAMLQGGAPVVLFLYMPWCGYCKKQKPVMDELAAQLGNIKFAAINAEQGGKKIASAMGITGFPAFLTNVKAKGGSVQAGAHSAPQMHMGYKDAQTFKQQVLGM